MLELLPIDTWPTARYSDGPFIGMKIEHPTATETLDTTLGDLTCEGIWLESNKIYGLLDLLSLMEGEEPVAKGEGVAFKRLSNTTYILRIALWAVDIRGTGEPLPTAGAGCDTHFRLSGPHIRVGMGPWAFE